jgi:hypothetical protein
VSPLAVSATVGCLGWPSRPNNPQRPLTPPPTGPLLVINARHDPATAFRWAQNVTAQLGAVATLVPYDGWGHVAYGRSGCVTGVVDRYLIGLEVPRAGAHCAAVPPEPFGIGRRAAPRPPGRSTAPHRTAPGWSVP